VTGEAIDDRALKLTLGSKEFPAAASDLGGPIVHVVGARPNFMKAAPVIAALRDLGQEQRLVHTGQHYDASLSDVFFGELGLPEPDVKLGIGSGSHASQTAAVMVAFEKAVEELHPSTVVVYGDVNSTLAAALVARKMDVPVAHVEAGLRSFDDSMPEEVNRRLTDHLSSVLFVTAPEGLRNLDAEGIDRDRVHFVGNPMIDTLLENIGRIDPHAVERRGLRRPYAVATFHRPGNVDDPTVRATVVQMLTDLAEVLDVIIPLHPRGRSALVAAGLRSSVELHVTDPLGYLEFISLVASAALVVTDSGGLQEETTVLGIPCLTVRPNTERPVTLTHGTNRLLHPADVGAAAREIVAGRWVAPTERPPLWDGHAGVRIAGILAARTAGQRSVQ
jgi:UDP-N-acetylglucosamine 2-epimerase (non-hydrolysing)